MKAMTDEQFELARAGALILLGDAVRELLGEITKSLKAQTACLERKARTAAKAGVLVLLAGAVSACSGSRPAPKSPVIPAPSVSPAPSPDAPATPAPAAGTTPAIPDGGTPTPSESDQPKHQLVEVCHIQDDGEGITLKVREGTFEEPGSRRWHIHRHRTRGDFAGPCKKRELRDVIREP